MHTANRKVAWERWTTTIWSCTRMTGRWRQGHAWPIVRCCMLRLNSERQELRDTGLDFVSHCGGTLKQPGNAGSGFTTPAEPAAPCPLCPLCQAAEKRALHTGNIAGPAPPGLHACNTFASRSTHVSARVERCRCACITTSCFRCDYCIAQLTLLISIWSFLLCLNTTILESLESPRST